MQAKATVTVEVQTYWGYKTTRTFELLPSPEWEQRAAEQLKVEGDNINRDIAFVYRHMDSSVLAKLERDATNERLGVE
jgi:hypothetical protein